MKRNAIILAAGKGTRMRSKLYKVLLPLLVSVPKRLKRLLVTGLSLPYKMNSWGLDTQ